MPDDPREPLGRTLGEVLHRARVAGGEQRPRPWPPEKWADRDPQLQALDEEMAEAVETAVIERLRTHEHEWTRCPGCKQPGHPCPCSGTVCCEMERREIAAANEAGREEQERAAARLAEIVQVVTTFRAHHGSLHPQADALAHAVMQVIDKVPLERGDELGA